MYDIKDIGLAPSGNDKIQWAKVNAPLLRGLEEEFRRDRPLEGISVALSIHLEAKTAYLCLVLAAGGARVFAAGSNPLTTQDDVAAALAEKGINVFSKYGCSGEEYQNYLRRIIESKPNIIVDDGGDLVNLVHNEYPELIDGIIGGCEETTTGIIRLLSMERGGKLRFPMVTVNNARCKYLFDNRYGTGQSVFDGINRTTNLIVAGKNVVVAGYGWCGKGTAMRAKGLGGHVIVTEVDPVKAMEAVMDGFEVMPMLEAAKIGDLFITVTGCTDVITKEAFAVMKNGALLCNAGHFNVEVDVAGLEEIAVEKKQQRNKNIMGYKLPNGNWLYLLAEGRLVNLAAGDGHPVEIMDMSFAIQALSVKYLVENKNKAFDKKVIAVPEEIDNEVARRKLKYWGRSIDSLTEKQQKYLNSYNL